MVLVYLRYSHFRISSTSEIKTLRKKSDEQASALRTADEKLVDEIKVSSQKIQNLLLEIDDLRKGKENETRLRLSTEKQLELTLQKMNDTEKRMEDWKVIQDTAMRDAKDAILKVGNDLYKKLNDSYKQEVETTRNLIGRVSKTVTDFFENAPGQNKMAASKTVVADSQKPEIRAEIPNLNVEDPTKKLVAEIVQTMKANGHLVNKNYFLPANFDEHKAKLLLCELAFVDSEILYVIDFKACLYLAEFDHLKISNKSAAEGHLKQRLDKYFSYLSDQKYHESVSRVMSTTKAKFEKTVTIVALPSKAELQALKEIRYFEKAERLGLEIMDMDGVSNIVL